MATGKNNLSIGRGERKTLRIVIENPPDGGIAAWTFVFKLYATPTTSTATLSKTTGFTVVDSADTVELLLDSADTSTLTPGVYYYRVHKADTLVKFAFGALTVTY